MAIGKRQSARPIVINGRKVSPELVGLERHEEVSVVHTVFSLVNEHELAARITNVSQPSVGPPSLLDQVGVPTVAIHIAVHRNAAGPQVLILTDLHLVLIGGALVDAERLIVGPQLPFGRHDESDIGAIPDITRPGDRIDPPFDPTLLVAGAVLNELIVVIAGVHNPGKRELFPVTDALHSGRLGLGLRQCGKEHSGENRDDGNDHEQFDQSEACSAAGGGGRIHGNDDRTTEKL